MTRYTVELIDRCHWRIDVEASKPEQAIARARNIWLLRRPNTSRPPRDCTIAIEARCVTHGAVRDADIRTINIQ